MEETNNATATIEVESSAMIENMKKMFIGIAEDYGTESNEWSDAVRFANATLGDKAFKEFCDHMTPLIKGKYKMMNATLRERKEWMGARMSGVRERLNALVYDMNDLDRVLSLELSSKIEQMANEERRNEREFLSADVARIAYDKERYSVKAAAMRSCKDILNN